MSADLEQALAQGVQDGKVPHVVVYATNRAGSFTYKHATGFQHLGKDDDPVQEDSLFMIASGSKVITAVAALEAVELGVIGLDENVLPHLPELVKLPVLRGFDENDRQILKNPITLRQLLSHSAGPTYGFDANGIKYATVMGTTSAMAATEPTIVERYQMPLGFEPGTSWSYGPGLDWAGLLVQRLTGSTLDAFEKKHFWDPLGLAGLTYWPSDNSEIPQLTVRGADGKLAPFYGETVNTRSQDCFGGHGMYARMGDYLQVLHSLLKNDGKRLKPDSVEELFKPQLGEGSKAALNAWIESWHTMIPGEIDPAIPMSYTLGGLVFLQDDQGRRKKGTVSWGGIFNTVWIVDRESELAFCFGTQVLPPGDSGCKDISGLAEKAVYRMARKA